jgi:tRNA-splicing ligase RtcB
MGSIRTRIPLGFGHHKDAQKWDGFYSAPDLEVVQKELKSARNQLGTLGGGNHFIEIQKGSDGHIWTMVHSGSRNFGLKIAKAFHELAVTLCDLYKSNIPDKDLSFLPLNTEDSDQYIEAMNFALLFAKENRLRMIQAVKESIIEHVPGVESFEFYDVHHNYARFENHYGENYMIHRKGATSARLGEIGIIPGSQGTKSYIVEGLGCIESFESCSHGAGRRMGRKEAQRSLDLEQEKKILDDQGIIHSIRNINDLDEATGAYKSIDTVMQNQTDLVKIRVELKPLAVIKG